MNNKTKYELTIKTLNNEEKLKVGESIHEQLVGNQDYIDCNIILNIDTDNTVKLWIFEECKNIPSIQLF